MLKKAGNELAQTAPPVGVTIGGLIFGLSLQDWVYVLTIVYTLLQIVRVIPRLLRSYRVIPEREAR